MPDTQTLAHDYATARKVALLLADDDIPAVAEEYEIGMAHIRLDPDDATPTGYVAVATDEEVEDDPDGGWVMIQTYFDEDLHTYEVPDDAPMEALGVPVDADPETVAEAILNFLS